MAHLALYRKYRPQTFGGLVGQQDIARALKNGVASKHTSHAYLFCGTRGTGKTSTARILAKALNCIDSHDGEPCNQCLSCKAITEGRSLDVIEIDAASNRGIEEARDLLEKVHFAPVESQYKIYIIDEVHMLTNDAFNAMLKTFEEPPSHVIFILATTEAQKVPLTILSRCQRYDFKDINETEIIANMSGILEKENCAAEPDALSFIARKALGSMRDALSLLDQAMGENSTNLTLANIMKLFGTVDYDFWYGFLKDFAEGNGEKVFLAEGELTKNGCDLRTFVSDLQEVLGDIMIGAGTGAYGAMIKKCRSLFTNQQILTLLTVFGSGEQNFRYNKNARMVYRYLMAKAVRSLNPPVVWENPVKTQNSQSKPTKKAMKSTTTTKKEENPTPMPNITKEVKSAPKGADSQESNGEVKSPEQIWPLVLREIRQKSRQTYTWLSPATAVNYDGSSITLQYSKQSEAHKKRMETDEHKTVLLETLKEICGKDIAVEITTAPTGDVITEANLFN